VVENALMVKEPFLWQLPCHNAARIFAMCLHKLSLLRVAGMKAAVSELLLKKALQTLW